jgi:hypothetical protein
LKLQKTSFLKISLFQRSGFSTQKTLFLETPKPPGGGGGYLNNSNSGGIDREVALRRDTIFTILGYPKKQGFWTLFFRTPKNGQKSIFHVFARFLIKSAKTQRFAEKIQFFSEKIIFLQKIAIFLKNLFFFRKKYFFYKKIARKEKFSSKCRLKTFFSTSARSSISQRCKKFGPQFFWRKNLTDAVVKFCLRPWSEDR